MIPLHLPTTTVHVSWDQAANLIQRGVAEWIEGVPALIAKPSFDASVAHASPTS